MKATKSQLRDEIHALRFAGSRMANICFNLGQGGSTVTDEHRRRLPVLAKNWDAVKRSEPTAPPDPGGAKGGS